MMRASAYRDRRHAGAELAEHLMPLAATNPLVLALPRGGVPVGYEVAKRLKAPLDVLIVRKIGLPGHEEFGIGALVVGDHPEIVMNQEMVQRLRPDPALVEQEIDRQIIEAERRRQLYIGDKEPEPVHDQTVIVVDDGIATGGTVRAALSAVRKGNPAYLALAVPVGPPDVLDSLKSICDAVICPLRPHPFGAVGAFYEDFSQTSDAEVRALLKQAEIAA